MTDQQIISDWLERYDELTDQDEEYSCRYGHYGCSINEGGACRSEVLCSYTEATGEEW